MIRPNLVSVFILGRVEKKLYKYLLIKRSGKYLNGIWQPVTGKVDGCEKISEAAFREVKEEVGLDIKTLHNIDVTSYYNPLDDSINSSANLPLLSLKLNFQRENILSLVGAP